MPKAPEPKTVTQIRAEAASKARKALVAKAKAEAKAANATVGTDD